MGWYVLSTALMLCILEKRVANTTGRQKTQPHWSPRRVDAEGD
jgi:hypothetical protein